MVKTQYLYVTWAWNGTSDGQITNQITSPNHKSFAKMI